MTPPWTRGDGGAGVHRLRLVNAGREGRFLVVATIDAAALDAASKPPPSTRRDRRDRRCGRPRRGNGTADEWRAEEDTHQKKLNNQLDAASMDAMEATSL